MSEIKEALTEEQARELVDKIVHYMFREGCTRGFEDDEKMQVPANFVQRKYPRKPEQDKWNPAVFYSASPAMDGYNYTVKLHDPELAELLGNLTYRDFLALQKALLETGIFRPDNFSWKHEERGEVEFISHEVHIFTTFGEIKRLSLNNRNHQDLNI